MADDAWVPCASGGHGEEGRVDHVARAHWQQGDEGQLRVHCGLPQGVEHGLGGVLRRGLGRGPVAGRCRGRTRKGMEKAFLKDDSIQWPVKNGLFKKINLIFYLFYFILFFTLRKASHQCLSRQDCRPNDESWVEYLSSYRLFLFLDSAR